MAALQKSDPGFKCSNAQAHAAALPAPVSDQVTGYHPKATSPTKVSPPPPALYAEYPVPLFMVRNDWTDLGLLGAGCVGPAGVSADKAKGASVSFTRDYAGNNKIWAAQGMAAAVYSDCWNVPLQRGGNYSGWLEKSIGVYAQINSDYNSNAALAKKNNLDTRTAGLSGELAYVHGADINVVRVTPNVVFDNIKGTTSVAVLAVCSRLAISTLHLDRLSPLWRFFLPVRSHVQFTVRERDWSQPATSIFRKGPVAAPWTRAYLHY